MVERNGADADPALVPTIAALLQQHRDHTGDSYDEMSRLIGEAISGARLHQLATKAPDSFPRNPQTIRHLANLLGVSITTVLEAFAVSLGLDVESRRPLLALTLPPGSDILDSRDVEAIRAVVRQLVDARRMASPPVPDLSTVAGVRLEDDETGTSARANTTRDG